MTLVLKTKAERAVHRRHPWIFSGAVEKVTDAPADGDLVRVEDAKGGFLAWGHYNGRSRLRVRLLDFSPEAQIDLNWWKAGLEAAVRRRQDLAGRPGLNSYRLVYSEADSLPGLVVDRFADFLVLQARTPGINRLKKDLAALLMEITGARGVFERSDHESGRLEGLEARTGPLAGDVLPSPLEIREGGLRFQVDPARGQKTGFFLDQRDNRAAMAEHAAGRRVLDCFSYTGAFAVYAAAAGAASVTRIESSAEAAVQGGANLALNSPGVPDEPLVADVFKTLRAFRDQGRRFDLIILDPPRLAPTRSHADKASRAYKDANLLALKLLEPGGILATFSCSQGVDEMLFQKIVFGAALDAGVEARLIKRLGQGEDHPVLLSFPESAYLKGFLIRV